MFSLPVTMAAKVYKSKASILAGIQGSRPSKPLLCNQWTGWSGVKLPGTLFPCVCTCWIDGQQWLCFWHMSMNLVWFTTKAATVIVATIVMHALYSRNVCLWHSAQDPNQHLANDKSAKCTSLSHEPCVYKKTTQEAGDVWVCNSNCNCIYIEKGCHQWKL